MFSSDRDLIRNTHSTNLQKVIQPCNQVMLDEIFVILREKLIVLELDIITPFISLVCRLWLHHVT